MKIRVLAGRPVLFNVLKSTLRGRMKTALLTLALISSLAGAAWYCYPALTGVLSGVLRVPVFQQLPVLQQSSKAKQAAHSPNSAASHREGNAGTGAGAPAAAATTGTPVAPETPPEKYILPASGRLIAGFGMAYNPVHKDYRWSDGLDIAVASGQPVLAPAAGRVVDVQVSNGLGVLRLEHAGGIKCSIGGLKTTPLPAAGQHVFQGEVIGYAAGTVPVHIAVSKYNRVIDPGEIFKW